MSTDKKAPMDATAKEQAVGTMSTNAERVCYALRTLVAEVQDLFPETPVEYSNYDGRNTALAATFDLTTLDGDDSVVLNHLLSLIDSDVRVNEIITADYDQAFISMRASARTQDLRDPFGLADALSVLSEEYGDDDYEPDLFSLLGDSQ